MYGKENIVSNPYESPEAELTDPDAPRSFKYVGFWARVFASIVDSLWMMLLLFPILFAVFGMDYLDDLEKQNSALSWLLQFLLPAMVVLAFWVYRSATPGKMILKAVIVDAKTGGKPTKGNLVLRYVCYYISIIPFLLGLIWVAFDKKKQGFHDKIAGTVVIKYTGPGE
jgi:uncharacterized RDD family membrane protein YckC